MDYVLAALTGYLLGSVPFGLLLTRGFGAGDVREIGSGSIGATNVLRTGRKGLAAATVLLDAGKGVAAVLLAALLWPGTEGLAAVAAIVGHCFPVWLRFKGGKGFATAAGVVLALAWPVFLVCAAIWAATLAISRISSVSSMLAVIAAPLAAWALDYEELSLTLIAIAAIVLVQHRANIGRLLRGEEPRVGRTK
ncbi:glycerol-3-phosphate 1-O-acyltransferase PlsY [Parafrankia sp. BMG5.11]|uniref:glycerol-3-phosphate 1-O-acyltransferase PlsY n=1 Tax=Parafrankia sp. BMG5.11 TaxID=222540 RepID=UPI001038F5E7|nr:glycerol-3-phosphate 1-O-acyltransferase PlsY [Parafrankia sp. BMG5.11]TCJ37232.1 glycerol-3-phosphate 1-O-acyltransferase [Parafrankia sp. BMG5.11]